jgi:hypothetical protein
VLVGVLIVLSFALAAIGGTAWWRLRARRLFLVTASFAVFLAKGIALAAGMYLFGWIKVPRSFSGTFDLMMLFDVLVLMILYLALFRKAD